MNGLVLSTLQAGIVHRKVDELQTYSKFVLVLIFSLFGNFAKYIVLSGKKFVLVIADILSKICYEL